MHNVETQRTIVLIDGVCVLCSRSYRFVKKRDRTGQFHFLTIQSPEGHALALCSGIDPQRPDTFVVIEWTEAYFRSDAVLHILVKLPGWQWTGSFRIIPPFIRDAIYDFVARNRYRWFGQLRSCMILQLPSEKPPE